jgi:hypothetical protein
MVKSFLQLKAMVLDNTPCSGADIGIRKSAGGFVPFLKRHNAGSSSSPPLGAFCKKYVEPGESPAPSTLFLLGGTVTGGEGNITIEDIELATVGSEPADGTHVWLEVAFTATEEDDVLAPGGDVTTATPGSGTTVPDNVLPTVSSLDGKIYISLGSWAQAIFYPSACGNILISHCPGSLTFSRA